MISSTNYIDSVIGLIILEISNQEFCLSIKDVYTIINPKELNQPGLYSPVFPHLTIDKSSVPVLRLHMHFDLILEERTEDTRIIIVDINNKRFGFIVDRVKEVFTVSKGLKEKLDFIPYEGNLQMKGTLLYKNRIFYLPDLQKIAEDHFKTSDEF